MKKYAIHPGTVRSRYDGERHFISADQLMRLYGVRPCDCVIIDYRVPKTFLNIKHKKWKEFIHLTVREDGSYHLPKEVS